MDTNPVPAPRRARVNRVLPPRPLRAAMVIGSFTALLYLIELANIAVFHGTLDLHGIVPRSVHGLEGIVWAPLLHGSWAHVVNNTIPILVFGFLAMAVGLRQWLAVTAVVWLVSGIGVWVAGTPDSVTVGASGLAFGWLAFLLVRGLFNRSLGQVAVALVLLFYWGSALWGLLPMQPNISWQAHLFGALGGVLAAWFLAARAKAPRPASGSSWPRLPGSLAA